MQCPKCGTDNMYDNTRDKRNPRSPDHKCRNKECGHGIWNTPKPQANGAPAAVRSNGSAPSYNWTALAMTYKRCYAIAGAVVGADNPDRQAATATLFIQATRMGLSVEAPKPAPPPPPPPPPVVVPEAADYFDVLDDEAPY